MRNTLCLYCGKSTHKETGICLIKYKYRYDFCSNECLKIWVNMTDQERRNYWRCFKR